MKQHEPEIFRNAHQFLQSNGYIVLKLTGCYSMDITHAGLTQLYDMHKEEWSVEICGMIELDRSKLPPVFYSYETVGNITDEAATATGLPTGIPVVAGFNDTAASSIGAGLIYPGKSFLVMGTAGAVGVCSDILPTNPALYNYHYLLPRTWFSIAPMAACGASLRWAKDSLFHSSSPNPPQSSQEAYAEMNEIIAGTNVGSGGVIFLPYMAGERSPIWDSSARGVFFGLTLATSRADMLRSIMEGTAFAIFQNILIMEECGIEIRDIINTGGGSKSAVWNQIIADVTGRTIHTVKIDETVTLGDAIAAAYGLKIFNDDNLAERTADFAALNETFSPNPQNRDVYLDLFELYKTLYKSLKTDFQTLSGVDRKLHQSSS
jgi:xylulokinase